MVTVRMTKQQRDSSTDQCLSSDEEDGGDDIDNDRPAMIRADLPDDVGNAGGAAVPDTEQVKAADVLCN